MATKQDAAPRAQRLAAVGAVATLAAATAIAFGRVFTGRAPTFKLLAAALASVLLASALERRSLLLATLVSAVALLVVVGVLVFPETVWLGAPTRATLGAAVDALARVGHEARVQVAPSPPLRPLILAALTAVWTASFSAHALAIRAGSPLLAVLPPVALVGFADTVLEDGARPAYALLLLVAALLVVFADGLRRIRQWGPVWSSPGRRRLSSVAGRGARRVGATTLVAALAFPGVLPGFRDAALVDFSTNGGSGVRLDPFVSIRANLTRDTPIVLYRVRATDPNGATFPSYWRAFSLDRFDGESWTSSDPEGRNGRTLLGTTALAPSTDPPDAAVTRVEQHIELTQEQQDAPLPMAYPPVSVDVPTAGIRYDAELGSVQAPGTLAPGSSYDVVSNVVVPTANELDGATPVSPDPRYTTLPPSLPPVIRQLAIRWASNASPSNPYRQILAIMEHFTRPGEFAYNDRVDTRDDADALVNFLTKTKAGFCQQFSTAMAVMVRALGYPARVAVGYRTGRTSGDGFTVTTEDAHSWVEVYFPRYGWLPFEPTPRRPNPIEQEMGSYLHPATAITGPGQVTGASGEASGNPNAVRQGPSACIVNGRRVPGLSGLICTGQQARPELYGPRRGTVGRIDLASERDRDSYGIPLRPVLTVLLLLGLALLVLVPPVKWALRLRVSRRRGPPRQMALAAFRLFDGQAADVGLGRRRGETLEEYRRRLSAAVAFSDGHLGRLMAVVTRAAYAGEEISVGEARSALRDARVAIREVRRSAGPARRVLGIYRLGI